MWSDTFTSMLYKISLIHDSGKKVNIAIEPRFRDWDVRLDRTNITYTRFYSQGRYVPERCILVIERHLRQFCYRPVYTCNPFATIFVFCMWCERVHGWVMEVHMRVHILNSSTRSHASEEENHGRLQQKLGKCKPAFKYFLS
jgi:hypothetical protein